MKKIRYYTNLIRLSAAASFLIGLGNYILLKIGEPIGPFLFSFGLLGVCTLGLNLFTGKCGYLIQEKIKIIDILLILATNLIFGYAFGAIFSIMDESISAAAGAKIATWDFSWAFFLKSIMCGAIMYLAVEFYRRGTVLGILIGVPLFILCGFQHSIANIITLGAATTFSWTIILAIIGNFIGSITIWAIASPLIQEKLESTRRAAPARRSTSTRKSTASRRTTR